MLSSIQAGPRNTAVLPLLSDFARLSFGRQELEMRKVIPF